MPIEYLQVGRFTGSHSGDCAVFKIGHDRIVLDLGRKQQSDRGYKEAYGNHLQWSQLSLGDATPRAGNDCTRRLFDRSINAKEHIGEASLDKLSLNGVQIQTEYHGNWPLVP